MNLLNKYKNCHKGRDIYVLASGKSVDFIPNSFFDNKIIIGVNQVYKKTKCNYLVRKDIQLLKEALQQPQNKETIHFISRGLYGKDNVYNQMHILSQFRNKKNIVLFSHNKNTRKVPDVLAPSNIDYLVVSHSTIVTAIHLAAYMGAKNILLIGHDGGMINNCCNFKGYHNDSTYKIAHKEGEKDYRKWVTTIDSDTIKLKKLLIDRYKCNICSINPFINFNLEGNSYQI